MSTRVDTNLQHVEVLAFVDLASGGLDDAGKGILSEASRLAGKLGGRWSAIGFAGSEPLQIEEFAPYGTPSYNFV